LPEGAFDVSEIWPSGVLSNRSIAGGAQRGKSSAKAAVSSRQRRAARKAATQSKTALEQPTIRPRSQK
jgi:hypothetical protein